MLRRFFIVLYLLTGPLAGMAMFGFVLENRWATEYTAFCIPLIAVVLIHFIVGFDV